jgi:hypothetical protein
VVHLTEEPGGAGAGAGIVIRRNIDFEDLEDVVRKRVHEELAKAVDKRQALTQLVDGSNNLVVVAGAPYEKTYQTTLKHIFLCEIPLMVQSKACFLSKLTAEMRFGLGECRHDVGGYFIIDGKECGTGLVPTPLQTSRLLQVDDHGCVVVVADASANPVPVFALFRALGAESDLEIIQYIVLDVDLHDDMVDALAPSVYHGATFAGDCSGCDAHYTSLYQLGYDVFQCLAPVVRPAEYRWLGMGDLLERGFREAWPTQVQLMREHYETELADHPADYQTNLYALVMDHHVDCLQKVRIMGIENLPELNRATFLATVHQLRSVTTTTTTPTTAAYGYIDPFDHSLALTASVSRATDKESLLEWMRIHWKSFQPLENFTPVLLADMTKVLINGQWVGVVDEEGAQAKFRVWRHNGLVPASVSMTFDYDDNRIDFWCDAGRLLRPLIYQNAGTMPSTREVTWTQILTGFHEKKQAVAANTIYHSLSDLYETTETNPNKLSRFDKEKSVVELLDEYESSVAYISPDGGTHMEIHPSLFLGWSSHHVALLEHQSAEDIRRTLHTMQKQVVGLSGTNAARFHASPVQELISGQAPVVKSRLLESLDQLTYGQNVVVAIQATGGGLWINEASLKRGLFAREVTTTTTTVEDEEEDAQHVICTTTKDGLPLIWHQKSTMSKDAAAVFTFRTGGGATLSALIMSEADMPFLGVRGERPDVVVSSDRVALLYELFSGKFATVMGSSGNGMPLDSHAMKSLGPQGRLLTAMGYHSSGNEIMYDGMTGRQIEVEVFTGVAFAMPLQANTEMRRRGVADALTRQPSTEAQVLQEVDVLAMLGHGLAATTQDALMTRGDETTMAVCNRTGSTAIKTRLGYFSPAVDGPVKMLEDNRVDYSKTTQKDFSVVQVPYAFKLLTQELMAMGVQMRLATDDQIDIQESIKKKSSTTHVEKKKTTADKKIRSRHGGGGSGFENVMNLLDLKGGGKKHKKEEEVPKEEEKEEEPDENELEIINLDDQASAGSTGNPDRIYSFSEGNYPYEKQSANSAPEGQASAVADREFRVNDKVCMRAVTDGYPARPWSIIRMGDVFLTVRALDTQQLQIKDQMKVVAKTDIIRAADIIAQQQLQQQQQQLLYGQPQQQPMVLNIAPKFVNGPDNSHVVPSTTVGQPMMDLGSVAAQPQQQQQPAPEKTTADDVDFSKGLIIVKKQS